MIAGAPTRFLFGEDVVGIAKRGYAAVMYLRALKSELDFTSNDDNARKKIADRIVAKRDELNKFSEEIASHFAPYLTMNLSSGTERA